MLSFLPLQEVKHQGRLMNEFYYWKDQMVKWRSTNVLLSMCSNFFTLPWHTDFVWQWWLGPGGICRDAHYLHRVVCILYSKTLNMFCSSISFRFDFKSQLGFQIISRSLKVKTCLYRFCLSLNETSYKRSRQKRCRSSLA